MPQTNQMPYNLEAEQSLLGCILIDQVEQMDIISALTSEDFLTESHKKIFDVMREISSLNKPCDLVTVADYLQKSGDLERVGGFAYLTELTQKIPSSANYGDYLDIVTRDGVLRRLITGSNSIIKNASESTDSRKSLQFAEKTIFDISESRDRKNLENIANSFDEVIGEFELVGRDKNALVGLKTGFSRLDYYTNGLKRGNLIILAARPSVGKTTFAMNIVENVAMKKDAVVAVFSLEMTRQELAQRLLCSVANVRLDDALKGTLAENDFSGFKRFYEAKKLLSKGIFVDDSTGMTPQDVLSKCRRLKARNNGKLDLVVIDHLQLMETAKRNVESRQQEVTDISKNLKMIAKELDVPLIALSQLSRLVTGRKGGRPMLSDLRESGAIEQDADIVLFLHRPDAVEGPSDDMTKPKTTELIISKNRQGECKAFDLVFRGEVCKFTDVAYTNDNPPPMTKADIAREESLNRPDDFASLTDDVDYMAAPPENDDNDVSGDENPF